MQHLNFKSSVIKDFKSVRHRWHVNLCLTLFSILLTLLFLEFVVFRYILIAPDYPQAAFVNGIIKYAPNQQGGGRGGQPSYHMNQQGWNSAHLHYTLAKPPGKTRIAIIGDSYVDGLHVDVDQSVAEKLERRLGPDAFEVYRFGMSGAPLSQYLYIFRREVLAYAPDIVIFILIHNDFDESYNVRLGSYAEAFMRLKLEQGQTVEEIEPQTFTRPWFTWIRDSASYRYLVGKFGLNIRAIKEFVNGQRLKKLYQANIDVSNMDTRIHYNYVATDYLFAHIKQSADKASIRLLFMMDGDRQSIYDGLPAEQLYKTGALRLNRMAQGLAAKYSIPFVDLHPVFEQDYRLRKTMFNWKTNLHWNEYGHALVAKTIASLLNK